jgi:DNA polymerase V
MLRYRQAEYKVGDSLRVVDVFIPEIGDRIELPMFLMSVSAGFPSPADDYLESKLDLNDYLVRNPSATFFVRVSGDSMIDAGIYDGDMLLVDRSLTPKDGSVVIAVINGELTVKRLIMQRNKVALHAENKKYDPIEITPEMSFEIWGVVSNVIHSVL